MKVKSLSRVQLFATPWTVAYQAPLSMGFYRQEYWSGLPFPSPGDLPDSGIKLRSPTLQANSLSSEPPRKPTMLLLLLLQSHVSCVQLCATPWTEAHHAPLSLGFSRLEQLTDSERKEQNLFHQNKESRSTAGSGVESPRKTYAHDSGTE